MARRRAGEDYTATSGTLTFAKDQGEATGTIENWNKMPKAWLARFGRTVAEQTVERVRSRLEAPRAAGAQATLGADCASGRWLVGAMVSNSLGEGSYAGDGGSGAVESALTGIYPCAAYKVTKRPKLWPVASYGEGTLTLVPENPQTGADDPARETDMTLAMGAQVSGGADAQLGRQTLADLAANDDAAPEHGVGFKVNARW